MAPAMEMSETRIEEYTEEMRGRYARMTGKKARGRLLDEFVEVTGWDRNTSQSALGQASAPRLAREAGCVDRYGKDLAEALKTCLRCGRGIWIALRKFVLSFSGSARRASTAC